MFKRIIFNLFKIKSMMTICVMIVFAVLALNGKMPIEVTASIITAVTTYYFTKESSDSIAEPENTKDQTSSAGNQSEKK